MDPARSHPVHRGRRAHHGFLQRLVPLTGGPAGLVLAANPFGPVRSFPAQGDPFQRSRSTLATRPPGARIRKDPKAAREMTTASPTRTSHCSLSRTRQTCPLSSSRTGEPPLTLSALTRAGMESSLTAWALPAGGCSGADRRRSEERRVGKEGRSRWSPYH